MEAGALLATSSVEEIALNKCWQDVAARPVELLSLFVKNECDQWLVDMFEAIEGHAKPFYLESFLEKIRANPAGYFMTADPDRVKEFTAKVIGRLMKRDATAYFEGETLKAIMYVALAVGSCPALNKNIGVLEIIPSSWADRELIASLAGYWEQNALQLAMHKGYIRMMFVSQGREQMSAIQEFFYARPNMLYPFANKKDRMESNPIIIEGKLKWLDLHVCNMEKE